MIADPAIYKVLDISTCHISEVDKENLENEAQYGIGLGTVYELADYGFLVYVGDLADNWSSDLVSPAFKKVMDVAKELGCDYVRFDRDGREYPELERFEW